jgi:hypothetical protein
LEVNLHEAARRLTFFLSKDKHRNIPPLFRGFSLYNYLCYSLACAPTFRISMEP